MVIVGVPAHPSGTTVLQQRQWWLLTSVLWSISQWFMYWSIVWSILCRGLIFSHYIFILTCNCLHVIQLLFCHANDCFEELVCIMVQFVPSSHNFGARIRPVKNNYYSNNSNVFWKNHIFIFLSRENYLFHFYTA